MPELSDFVIVNGVLKEYKGNDLVVTVPDGVVKIAAGGLGNNTDDYHGLTEVVLPDSVCSIDKNAFFSKRAKDWLRFNSESLNDYREHYLPKKMNIPKDYLKQPNLDLSLVYYLINSRGPWSTLMTEEDCRALMEHFDEMDLPPNVKKKLGKSSEKKASKPIESIPAQTESLGAFYDPEPHRKMEDVFLQEMKEEYPSGVVDSLKKQMYVKGLILAARFGFDSIEKYLAARGYTSSAKNKKIKMKSNDESFGRDLWGCEIHAHVFDISTLQSDDLVDLKEEIALKARGQLSYEEKKKRFEEFIEQINYLMENTPGINKNGLGYTIRVENSFFNERTDLEQLSKLEKEHNFNLPYDLKTKQMLTGQAYEHTYMRRSEDQQRRRENMKKYMAATALFVYPGQNVYLEVFGYSDNTFATEQFYKEYDAAHPERTYIVVNADTGVEIKALPKNYRFSHKDVQGQEYAKYIKEPLSEECYEIGMDGSNIVWRLKKEIIDGRTCLCGVPLDCYDFIHFDEILNRYIITPQIKQDLISGAIFGNNQTWEFEWNKERYKISVPSFSGGMRDQLVSYRTFRAEFRFLMPTEEETYSYPAAPKKDVLLSIINRIDEWRHMGQVSKTDIENYLILKKFFPNAAGKLTSYETQIRTSEGYMITISSHPDKEQVLYLTYSGKKDIG